MIYCHPSLFVPCFHQATLFIITSDRKIIITFTDPINTIQQLTFTHSTSFIISGCKSLSVQWLNWWWMRWVNTEGIIALEFRSTSKCSEFRMFWTWCPHHNEENDIVNLYGNEPQLCMTKNVLERTIYFCIRMSC